MTKRLVVVVGVTWAIGAWAGDISGTVVDMANRKPLAFVRVSATKKSDGKVVGEEVITDMVGHYVLSGVADGVEVNVSFSKTQYERRPTVKPATTKKTGVIVDCRLAFTKGDAAYFQAYGKEWSKALKAGDPDVDEFREVFLKFRLEDRATVREAAGPLKGVEMGQLDQVPEDGTLPKRPADPLVLGNPGVIPESGSFDFDDARRRLEAAPALSPELKSVLAKLKSGRPLTPRESALVKEFGR